MTGQPWKSPSCDLALEVERAVREPAVLVVEEGVDRAGPHDVVERVDPSGRSGVDRRTSMRGVVEDGLDDRRVAVLPGSPWYGWLK